MDVNRLSVPSGMSDQLQECETSNERLNQMHMLLHKFVTSHKRIYEGYESCGPFACP